MIYDTPAWWHPLARRSGGGKKIQVEAWVLADEWNGASGSRMKRSKQAGRLQNSAVLCSSCCTGIHVLSKNGL